MYHRYTQLGWQSGKMLPGKPLGPVFMTNSSKFLANLIDLGKSVWPLSEFSNRNYSLSSEDQLKFFGGES